MPIDPNSPEWTSTESFALLFRDAAAALVDADPAGVVSAGTPTDEYDVEAAQIVRLVLAGARSPRDVLEFSVEVLAYYCGGDSYEERLAKFADVIWHRYQELQQDG